MNIFPGALHANGSILRTDHDGDVAYLWTDRVKVRNALGKVNSIFCGFIFIFLLYFLSHYFTSHHITSKLGAIFKVTSKNLKMGSVDLKRYAVRSGGDINRHPPTGYLDRVNADHENTLLDWVTAKYNSGLKVEDVFPLRVLGGEGPLAHCKIPHKAEEMMSEMFGVYVPYPCSPLLPPVTVDNLLMSRIREYREKMRKKIRSSSQTHLTSPPLQIKSNLVEEDEAKINLDPWSQMDASDPKDNQFIRLKRKKFWSKILLLFLIFHPLSLSFPLLSNILSYILFQRDDDVCFVNKWKTFNKFTIELLWIIIRNSEFLECECDIKLR